MKNIIEEEMKKGKIHSSFFKKNNITPEEAYLIVNDMINAPKCPICGNAAKFKSFNFGYVEYCGQSCANSGKWQNTDIEKANLKRKLFWENNPEKKIIKDNKISETNSKVWASGTKLRINQTRKVNFNTVHEKGSQTKLERYGDKNPWRFGSDKFRQCLLEIYGVNNCRLIEGMTDRIQNTFLEKYNVLNSIDLPGVREKSLKTKRNNFLNRINDIESLTNYYKKVWSITNSNDLTTLKNYELRGRADIDANAYHLDHIYSISEGYLNGVDPEIIGSIENLQMIHWKENIIKGSECHITLENLNEKIQRSKH